ncbi:Rap1 GTPase-GDP dissociation stimulator 1-A [Paramyrothecium foliicola]|nr:Rap1 GTPase-GDP dissociation stimulator 1-A [Paramyrothecium foliicola]
MRRSVRLGATVQSKPCLSGQKTGSVASRLPVFVNLWLEPFFHLGGLLHLLPYGPNLALESLLGAHNLALQVEAAALLRVIGVEEALVALQHLLHVGLTSGGRLDVEDAARLVERHARGQRCAARGAAAGLARRALVGGGGLGLLVRGDEGAAEDSGACKKGRDDELVSLAEDSAGSEHTMVVDQESPRMDSGEESNKTWQLGSKLLDCAQLRDAHQPRSYDLLQRDECRLKGGIVDLSLQRKAQRQAASRLSELIFGPAPRSFALSEVRPPTEGTRKVLRAQQTMAILTPDEVAALLQQNGSSASFDDNASQPADPNQKRVELLNPVLDACEEAWKSGSETIDLLAQKLGDGSRDVAWRIPYGESGVLDFFLRVLAAGGLRQGLQVHTLRIIGNSCADTDENRARLVQDKRLELVVRELQDVSLIPFTIPVLFNILVDYEPAQLLASQLGASSHLVNLLSSPAIVDYTPYINYFCKILALIVGQEGEPAVTNPNTVPVLLKLALDQDLPDDAEDFVSLVAVAGAYLGSDEAQSAFVETPEVGEFLSVYERVHVDLDTDGLEDEDLATQVKQLRTSLLSILAGVTGHDSFFSRNPFSSPVSQRLWAWLDGPKPQLQAAACLAMGNLVRSDQQSIELVKTHSAHKPLIKILSNPDVHDTQLLHSALSFLKNLAIPLDNKPILGTLLEPSCVPRIYTLDTVPQVQYAAVSLTRLLLVNCPPNVRRLCAILGGDQSTSEQTSVHGILSLFGRSDAEPTRLEAARSIAVICRALHSNPPSELLPAWEVPATQDETSGEVAEDVGARKRRSFYQKHDFAEALAFLVTQPKWPIIRSEAWFVFALMCRSKDGAALVTTVLQNQAVLESLTATVTGKEKDQGTSNQVEAPSTAESDLAAMAGGLNLEPQQVDPSQKANMAKVDRENAVVLCTELLKAAGEDLPAELSSSLRTLVKEGTQLIAADKGGATKLGLSLVTLALLTSTLVPGGAAGLAQLDVGTALYFLGHVTLLDLLEGDVGGGDGESGGDEGGLLDLGEVGLGVALLGGVGLAGQQDQALLVGLEAGDVEGERLLAEVLAAVVDRDANGGGNAAGDASLLQWLLAGVA